MKLKGRTAIITGASIGLGKAIATEFIKEGANVIICARNSTELRHTAIELKKLTTPEQIIYPIIVDVSNTNDMDGLYRIVISKFDKIDILVNNAGIQGPIGLMETTNWEEYINSININLLGVVYACKLFIPHFRANNYGRIINISGGGAANPRANFSAYAIAKTAVVRFTECIAEELKGTNITANSISPGALNTRLFEEALSAGPLLSGKEYHEKALKQKESGGSDPFIAAKLCTFLASQKSNYITGKMISAIWDDWENLKYHLGELKNNDIYTLRRILPKDKGLAWGDIK